MSAKSFWLLLRTAWDGQTRRSRSQRRRRLVVERLEDRRLLSVSLGINGSAMAERGGTAVVTAYLSQPESGTTAIDLEFRGTALPGIDYVSSNPDRRIIIPAGAISGSLTLAAIDDALVEPEDSIAIAVASISGSSQEWDGQPVFATIIDDDAPTVINGTSGNDILTIDVRPDGFSYRLNDGASTDTSYSAVATLQFIDGGASDLDTIVVVLSPGMSSNFSYAVTLGAGSVSVIGAGDGAAIRLDVVSVNVERQYVNGSARDSAILKDTPGNDVYWGRPEYSVMTSANVFNQVTGIRFVTANSSAGSDIAVLYGGGLGMADKFVGGPTSSSFSSIAGSTPYRNTVNQFRYVYAFSDQGDSADVAVLNDSAAADHFVSTPTTNYMLSNGDGPLYYTTRVAPYQNTVFFFRNVYAYSTDDYDSAYLYDSPGNDVLYAYNTWTQLITDSCSVLANGFHDVIAISLTWQNGERDQAVLYDSWAETLDRGRDDYFRIYDATGEMNYGNRMARVTGFEAINALRVQGGLGLDTYLVQPNQFAASDLYIDSGFVDESSLPLAQQVDLQKTRNYLRDANQFNVARYTYRGTDYLNPEFYDLPGRLQLEWSQDYPSLPPLTSGNLSLLLTVEIYDFSRLEQVQNNLAGIDRRSVLQRLFDEITRNAPTDIARHRAMTDFGHKALMHNEYLQPLNFDAAVRASTGRFVSDHTGVYDPLVLLELAEGRCGQRDSLVLDLYNSVGHDVRLAVVNNHTTAEVYYGGQWHLIDPGRSGGDAVPLVPVAPGSSTLKVPSLAELSSLDYRYLMDTLSFQPPAYGNPALYAYVGSGYGSWAYFADDRANQYVPNPLPANSPASFPYFYRVKAGTYQEWQATRDYGWNTSTITSNRDWNIYHVSSGTGALQSGDLIQYFQPWAPQLTSVAIVSGPSTNTGAQGGMVHLAWNASLDADNDVLGYRVFVSRTSRGWNYNGDSLPAEVMPYKSIPGPWTPAMYDRRYALPPGEVMTLTTADTAINIALPATGDYFISVMPFDAHGQAVGNQLYLSSEEIRITV